MAESKTLQAMLATVLQRFPVQRIFLVADRGLLSLDDIGEITALADQGGRKLEFILAVPARRYGELAETFQGFAFSEEGLAEYIGAGSKVRLKNTCRGRQFIHAPQLLDGFPGDLNYCLHLLIGFDAVEVDHHGPSC